VFCILAPVSQTRPSITCHRRGVGAHDAAVGVVLNSLQDIGRASDGAKRRPVEAKGWAGE
jgi:hypothetical protein